MIVITRQGDVLDALCLAHYGHNGALEAVLAANPGLAALGPIYPAGVEIFLPDNIPAPSAPRATLWGQ